MLANRVGSAERVAAVCLVALAAAAQRPNALSIQTLTSAYTCI